MIIYEEVLRDFQKEKVKYVLVGGIALNLHGSLRNTADLDILVEMSDENLEKIVLIPTWPSQNQKGSASLKRIWDKRILRKAF